MVSLLWKYSLSLWGYRNAVVHGSNYEESAFKHLQEIQSKVSAAYDSFSSDPNSFLPRHHYLFHTPLRTCLHSSYDNMQCFLRSVTEAQHVMQHQQAILQCEASRYFQYSSDDSDDSFKSITSTTDTNTMLTTSVSTHSTSLTQAQDVVSDMASCLLSSSLSSSSSPPSVITWSTDTS